MEKSEAESTIQIRAFISQDKEDLLRILKDTKVFQDYEIDVADEVLADALNPASTYRCYCAVNGDDHPIGYVCWGPTPCTIGTFDLYWIAVHPDYWGTGVGKKLLNAAEENARQMNARLMIIETSSVNDYDQTRTFYIKSGYKQLALVPEFYRPGDHKIIYGKYFVS